MFIDTILIGGTSGTDIRALPWLKVRGIDGIWAPGQRRGDDTVAAGADGEIGNELPLAKYVLTANVTIKGATRGERNDNLRSLMPIVSGTNGLLTIARRVATGSTGDDYDEHESDFRFITGLTPQIMNPYMGFTQLQWYNLRGAWFSGSGRTVPIVP